MCINVCTQRIYCHKLTFYLNRILREIFMRIHVSRSWRFIVIVRHLSLVCALIARQKRDEKNKNYYSNKPEKNAHIFGFQYFHLCLAVAVAERLNWLNTLSYTHRSVCIQIILNYAGWTIYYYLHFSTYKFDSFLFVYLVFSAAGSACSYLLSIVIYNINVVYTHAVRKTTTTKKKHTTFYAMESLNSRWFSNWISNFQKWFVFFFFFFVSNNNRHIHFWLDYKWCLCMHTHACVHNSGEWRSSCLISIYHTISRHFKWISRFSKLICQVKGFINCSMEFKSIFQWTPGQRRILNSRPHLSLSRARHIGVSHRVATFSPMQTKILTMFQYVIESISKINSR